MSQKKRILHIIQSLGNGGCENMLLRTLPLLDDFEHKIITLKELGDLASKFVSVGIAVETIHCDGLLDISGIFRLRKIVTKGNPDIILTYLFHADVLGRLALHNATKATIIPFLRTTYNHPKYLIARILEWLTKPIVNRYLANSEAVKDFYVKNIGIHQEKITVIPNGIDVEYFDSIKPNLELRKSIGIHPNDFVIICVSNLHINKGHKYLLEAFEKLHTSNNETAKTIQPFNFRLLLVGDGPEKENLQNQSKNYQSKKNILFLGKRTDVPQLLRISNLFILPTLFEGQSNALMEAMASGLPIITTDIPENKVLIENEKTGLLVPIKNSKILLEGMLSLIKNDNLRMTMGQSSQKSIKENFNLKKTTSLFSDFLSNSLKK